MNFRDLFDRGLEIFKELLREYLRVGSMSIEGILQVGFNLFLELFIVSEEAH